MMTEPVTDPGTTGTPPPVPSPAGAEGPPASTSPRERSGAAEGTAAPARSPESTDAAENVTAPARSRRSVDVAESAAALARARESGDAAGGVDSSAPSPEPAPDAGGTAPRQPGRPRSREANDAILSAALELLVERKNIAEISVEAIAARAGVGKATIYRRWSGKEELFTDAVATLRSPLPSIDGPTVRDDLVAILTQVCGEAESPLDRAIGVLMMNESHPGLAARVKRTVFAPRDEQLRTVLRRGEERGELRPGVDPEMVHHMLVGAVLFYRGAGSDAAPAERARALVDTLLTGLAAPASPVSPASPAT